MPRLFVIAAFHNRRELTVRAVEQLFRCAKQANLDIFVTMFDDGSTDGTANELLACFPTLRIVRGDGSAYWAKGMAIAEREVLLRTDLHENDYVVWLNDDVDLDDDSISRAFPEMLAAPQKILVGAMRSPKTGGLTYSGFIRAGHHPLRLVRVEPGRTLRDVESFNGNLVFVPVKIAQDLGGIDGGFSHAWADIDYGFRAAEAGVSLQLLPGFAGSCARNEPIRLDLRSEWKAFVGPKGGGHFRSLLRILRRHGGPVWPLYLATTYVLWWLRQSRDRILRYRVDKAKQLAPRVGR